MHAGIFPVTEYLAAAQQEMAIGVFASQDTRTRGQEAMTPGDGIDHRIICQHSACVRPQRTRYGSCDICGILTAILYQRVVMCVVVNASNPVDSTCGLRITCWLLREIVANLLIF